MDFSIAECGLLYRPVRSELSIFIGRSPLVKYVYIFFSLGIVSFPRENPPGSCFETGEAG